MTEGWRERALEEYKQLQANAEKITDFIDSDEYEALDPDGKSWLLVQSYAMTMYCDALRGRLGIE